MVKIKRLSKWRTSKETIVKGATSKIQKEEELEGIIKVMKDNQPNGENEIIGDHIKHGEEVVEQESD